MIDLCYIQCLWEKIKHFFSYKAEGVSLFFSGFVVFFFYTNLSSRLFRIVFMSHKLLSLSKTPNYAPSYF